MPGIDMGMLSLGGSACTRVGAGRIIGRRRGLKGPKKMKKNREKTCLRGADSGIMPSWTFGEIRWCPVNIGRKVSQTEVR